MMILHDIVLHGRQKSCIIFMNLRNRIQMRKSAKLFQANKVMI